MKLEKKRKGFATRLPIEIHEWLHSQSQKMNSSINSEIVRALQIVMANSDGKSTQPKSLEPTASNVAPEPDAITTGGQPIFAEYSAVYEQEPDGTDALIKNPDFAITSYMASELFNIWRDLIVTTEVLNRYKAPPKAWLCNSISRKSHGVALTSSVRLFGEEILGEEKKRGMYLTHSLKLGLKRDDILPAIERRHTELLAQMASAQDRAFARFSNKKAEGKQ